MKKLQEQLNELIQKYQPYILMAYNNMRLILLVIFSVLCGILVYRINTLVNSDLATVQSLDQPSSDITTKQPDKDVTSVFNELQSKSVTLSSEFIDNRVNPF